MNCFDGAGSGSKAIELLDGLSAGFSHADKVGRREAETAESSSTSLPAIMMLNPACKDCPFHGTLPILRNNVAMTLFLECSNSQFTIL